MRILVTGAAGFIGANFVHYVLAAHPGDEVVALDLLTYAGNLDNLRGLLDNPRHRFVRGDIRDRPTVEALCAGVEAVVNFAAETHVDRSIDDPQAFLTTNVLGTRVLLDAAQRSKGLRFIHVSTDEVYGSADHGERFSEEAPLRPSSPYAASKAAADLLIGAYRRTYGVAATITRCTNNFGPFQFPEKLIPLFITNALEDRPLPLYGDGLQVRDWLHVEDHCRAVDLVLRRGRPGAIYNIGADNPRTNREITERILDALGKPRSLVRHVADRPGHDRRYAVDSSRLRRELGWAPQLDFDAALAATVDWYRRHREWWEAVRRGEYRDYYERMYGVRLREGRAAQEEGG